jgi:hypothetical protein
MLPFEPIARALLFVHLVAAVVAVGAAAHLMVRYLRSRPDSIRPRLPRLHARILVIAYSVCWVAGALLYPIFRVRVRQEIFDIRLPWATGLFEAKEHLANIGLVAAIGLWLLITNLSEVPGDDRRVLPLLGMLLGLVLAVLFYGTWTGWYLATLKAV